MYADIVMHAPIRDTWRTWASLSVGSALKSVGKTITMQANNSIPMLISAAFTGNFCSFSKPTSRRFQSSPFPLKEWYGPRFDLPRLNPPRKKDVPNTSKMLESTDPNKDALTMLNRPARMDWTDTIISTALPNVAFSKPLTVSLRRETANSSVASPRIFASGTSAKKFSQNVHWSPQPCVPATMPSGTQTRGTQNGCTKIVLSPSMFCAPTIGKALPERAGFGFGRGGASSSSTSGSCNPLFPGVELLLM
mmetsp:Transcript_29259/g.88549  ORF Transcript_29259/g.88549 Transcript_29259/m.88549 type:complete len:250 (+) Transcript_29259:410-1159(+)